MKKIYYAVTPKWSSVTRYADEKDFKRVYDLVWQITQNDNDSIEASSWCELASIGETYLTNLFKIEIIED